MSENYWLKVLEHFDEKGYFNNGLTIPFLIGSNTEISSNQNLISVRRFISQIMNKEIKEQIKILKCSHLDEYVFGILDDDTIKYIQLKGTTLYRQVGNLVIIDNSFQEIEEIEEIENLLEELYQEIIDSKKFSKENGKWGPYSKIDLGRLKEIR